MTTLYIHRGIALPAHLRESLDAYIDTGRPLGGFLSAVVDNNLKEACARADEESVGVIHVIVAFLYNEAVAGCWGFAGAHQKWVFKHTTLREAENRSQATTSPQ